MLAEDGLQRVGRHYSELDDDALVQSNNRVIVVVFALFMALMFWAYFATLDEVSSGQGKVVPSSKEQVIQSLDGGILAELRVQEGDIVERGAIVAMFDETRARANVQESAVKHRAALATAARLEAEVGEREVSFPAELDAYPELMRGEMELYQERQKGLAESTSGVEGALKLIREELRITESLAKVGAASNVEVFRLQRQVTELETKLFEIRSQFMVGAREQLAKVNADMEALASVTSGRSDSLNRLVVRSPVRGVIKDIEVTTIGGVIPPNGRLMSIVPLDEKLLIEAKVSPRDIAFIHPGQGAKVKITAYDYAIYGGLEGEVSTISPDTIQDETDPSVYYYRVFISTSTDFLENDAGKEHPIVPGMLSTVDIKTGSKTVWDYLIKPLNKAKEALRER